METERTLRFVVGGRVQQVGFRAFVHAHATALGLRGWVANLPSGDVEVVASGPWSSLSRLREHLEHGPPLARIDRVEVEELPEPAVQDDRFEVRY